MITDVSGLRWLDVRLKVTLNAGLGFGLGSLYEFRLWVYCAIRFRGDF